jgi:Lysozyme like domain
MKKRAIREAALKLALSALICSLMPGFNPASAIQDSISNSKSDGKEASAMEYSYLSDLRNKDHLTDEDLVQVLFCAGFRGQDLKEAWAVAKKESNGRPLAYNGNRNTGDNSYGVFQINMIDELGQDRREKFNLTYNRDLLDPVTNATIAFHMSQGGKDWSSWKGMTPKTKEWLLKYPKDFKPLQCKDNRKSN